jgi:hypothetical protein
MTPEDELERIVDLAGLQNVLTLLAVICDGKADRVVTHDAHAAKQWLDYASAINAVIVKLWGRL